MRMDTKMGWAGCQVGVWCSGACQLAYGCAELPAVQDTPAAGVEHLYAQ